MPGDVGWGLLLMPCLVSQRRDGSRAWKVGQRGSPPAVSGHVLVSPGSQKDPWGPEGSAQVLTSSSQLFPAQLGALTRSASHLALSRDPMPRVTDSNCISFLGLPAQSTTDWSRKQQTFIFFHFRRLEVLDQGVGRIRLFCVLSPWLADGAFSLCLHMVVPLCVCALTASSHEDTSHI